ncbi:glycosyltransferase [Roseibacterium sp. SDUM158017]|uniref:glycosyltransferase family 2 protein n=1 Tax=Roseicyclus salinarum TaxID=3036773 RepID=UPI0024158BB9|nr:glycosyltransferase [Roseibacterium sp. SDUM158017]MDG4649646.1 glycosyltransferase [Roseibacterium sp. SDUM158017]
MRSERHRPCHRQVPLRRAGTVRGSIRALSAGGRNGNMPMRDNRFSQKPFLFPELSNGVVLEPSSRQLTWTLCIATLNRLPILTRAIRLALQQSRMPSQIVVVDASDNWQEHADTIRPLTEAAGVPLAYLEAPKRSGAAQRNRCIAHATGDILFVLDDDSLMYPDCAAEILKLYEADTENEIAAIGCRHVPVPPEEASRDRPPETEARKNDVGDLSRGLRGWLRTNAFLRWINNEVFMQSSGKKIVPFDPPGTHVKTARAVEDGRISAPYVTFIAGYALTVRRSVAEKEPFEDALMAYSPTEDLDATYRFGRHGVKIVAPAARLHHFETARGRIGRATAVELSAMNVAYYIRRSGNQGALQRAYYALMRRRILAEFLKDGLTGRFDLPQMRGMMRGVRSARRIFDHADDGLKAWYEARQLQALGWTSARAAAPGQTSNAEAK